MNKQTATYKKLKKSLFKNNHTVFCAGLAFSLISGLAMLIISYVLGAIIDAISAMDLGRIIRLIIFSAVSCAALTVNELLSYGCTAVFYRNATINYCQTAFKGIAGKNISAFSRESSSSYISMLTNDVRSIQDNYLSNIFSMGQQIVMFFGALIMMLVYSPLLTLVTIALSFLPVIIAVIMTPGLTKREKMVSDDNEKFVRILKDILSGFAVVKSFKSEVQVISRFAETNKTVEQTKFKRRLWSNVLSTFSMLGGVIMQLGVFFFGAYLAISGKILAGTILIFVNLCNCLLSPIQVIPQCFSGMGAAKAVMAKLADILDANPTRTGGVTVSDVKKGIEFKDVSFSYEEDKQIIKDISINIEQGKKYAIVGNSGSGKSTLLNLLMGAYDNYGGSITIDDTELRSIKTECLYDLISLIDQNVFLFDDTIYKNVTMFSERGDNEVMSAIERAGLSELIKEKGRDYYCGENGVNLSGGEKQRVSIARCLLRNTPVLLLDEATAALDNKTSFEIVNDILNLRGLTGVVVTHRLEKDLLKQYDGIFVLWNGAVAENGTFDELMEKKGRFYSLYTLSE